MPRSEKETERGSEVSSMFRKSLIRASVHGHVRDFCLLNVGMIPEYRQTAKATHTHHQHCLYQLSCFCWTTVSVGRFFCCLLVVFSVLRPYDRWMQRRPSTQPSTHPYLCLQDFHNEGMLSFVIFFSANIEIMCFLTLSLFKWYIKFIDLCMLTNLVFLERNPVGYDIYFLSFFYNVYPCILSI